MSLTFFSPDHFDDGPPSDDEVDNTVTITADEARYISKTYLGKKISKAIRTAAKSPTVTELIYENVGKERVTQSIVDNLRRNGFTVEEQNPSEYYPEGGWWIRWGQTS